MRRRLLVAAALVCTGAVGGVPAALAEPAPGAPGLGDSFFPSAGNGGYDAGHYGLRLRYDPADRILRATATIESTAAHDLSSFNLDYDGPRVKRVTVAGVPAAFSREGRELIVTPAAAVIGGTSFTTVVEYAGRPRPITDPDGSQEGWFETEDGAVAVQEPRGAISWYPSNDTPVDKAAFDISITVPKRLKAISNGALVEKRRRGPRTTWSWREDAPMATYLATVAIGRFELDRSRVDGVASVTAVDPALVRRAKPVLAKTGRILRVLGRLFGPYPFGQVGAIVDQGDQIGYAIESQTRPFYPEAPGVLLHVHELAHQWFGDSVGLARWQDIWLNEGFATWAEWRWEEERGGQTTAKTFSKQLATPASQTSFWDPPPAVPGGPEELFATSTYQRGAMCVEALRQEVGDRIFYSILQTWTATHRYATATTEEFIALAEELSGRQLDDFFRLWLYAPGKPSL